MDGDKLKQAHKIMFGVKMKIKEELEKHINLERSKLKRRDDASKKLNEDCKVAFIPAAKMLRELEGQIDEKYASFDIDETKATINIMANLVVV